MGRTTESVDVNVVSWSAALSLAPVCVVQLGVLCATPFARTAVLRGDWGGEDRNTAGACVRVRHGGVSQPPLAADAAWRRGGR